MNRQKPPFLKPELRTRFKERYNEMLAQGDYRADQWAEAELAAQHLPASGAKRLVEQAVWAIVMKAEEAPEKLPTEQDLKSLKSFERYFRKLLATEAKEAPIQALKTKAQKLIEELRPASEKYILLGLNLESVCWLEYHIEELRGTAAVNEQREELLEKYGAFLGECIRLLYGGNWAKLDGAWAISFGPNRAVSPFALVEDQLTYGRDAGIECAFKQLANRFDLGELPEQDLTRADFVRSLLDLDLALKTREGQRWLLSRRPQPPLILEQLKDQLMAYFGQKSTAEGTAQLQADIQSASGTAHILREGLRTVLEDPLVNAVELVESCAGQNVQGSERKAREWLEELQRHLFPEDTAT